MPQPQIFTIQKIVQEKSKLNLDHGLIVWQQFVKWCFSQFDLNRHVNFSKLGDYGFKLEQETNKKIPFFFFNEAYLNKLGLLLEQKSFVLKPIVKINYQMIKKNISQQNISEEFIRSIIQRISKSLQKILNQTLLNYAVVDFDILGKIIKTNNLIRFQYSGLIKKQNLRNSSLRVHINKQQSKLGNLPFSKISLLTSREGFLPKIQKKQLKSNHKQKLSKQKEFFQLERISAEKHSSLSKLSSAEKPRLTDQHLIIRKHSPKITNVDQQHLLKNRSNSLKNFTKTRINSMYKPADVGEKNTQNLGWQMMGAGSDPLKKSQSFSNLTKDLKNLMQAKFTFKKADLIYNIPIIDIYSRTYACPIATQRQSPLTVGRIGANFCLKSQLLQVGEQGIIYSKLNNHILTSNSKQNSPSSMTQKDEYIIFLKQQKKVQQIELLKKFKFSYQRFFKFFKLIPQNHIYQIQSFILQRLIFNLKHFQNGNELIFQNTLSQIQQNHIKAIKKSILNYILLDKVQKDRLSLDFNLKKVPFYGQITQKAIRWQNFSLTQTRKKIQENLMINSLNTLKLVKFWDQNYFKANILTLTSKQTEYFTIDDFCDKQKMQIKKFKTDIVNNWIPLAAQIYKSEVFNLNKNMGLCQKYFQSTSTLLFNKLRQKIMETLKIYETFFQQFSFIDLNPPQTVVHLQKTLGIYEKSFISVRISHRREEIYFMDNISEIQAKLVQIVNFIRQLSVNIPRPENLIIRTKKPFLIQINESQFDYTAIKGKISRIISKNIENAKKSLQIYHKYVYLLSQSKKIDIWVVNEGHDRRQYSLTLTKYRKLYQEVMQEVPFFMRINMILVDSSQLKRHFLGIIQQIISKVGLSIFTLVITKNTQIQTSLDRIIFVSSSHANSCQKLVEIQNEVDNFRRLQLKKLQIKQQDLIKWISITLYSSFYPVQSQDLKKIFQTSEFLRVILQKLDKQAIHMEQERRRLQLHVREDGKILKNKTKILVKGIQQLKQFGGSIVKDSALQLLKQSRKNINLYKDDMLQLNKKQQLLGIDQTELDHLQQWDIKLIPFQDLWNLVEKFSSYQHSWSRQNIFKQDSIFIENQCKSMFKVSLILSNNEIIKGYAALNLKVSQTLSEQIKNFQRNIPLVAIFSNIGLKERHHRKITEILQYSGQNDLFSMNLTLYRVLGMGAGKYIQQLQSLNDWVTKQYIVQQIINEVRNSWNTKQFEIKKYKNTQTYMIATQSIEDIQSLLDQHMLKILSVKGSIYAEYFQKQLEELQQWLIYTSKLVEISVKVQISWKNLEPVMASPDILKHLSVQGSKFMVVNQNWKKIMTFYHEKRLILQISKNRDILKKLYDCQKSIQIVQKGLYAYLQFKRMSFPRFFFLSDKELLQILSQTKEPMKVQRYLTKLFEAIQSLKFQQDRYIVGMNSCQNQYVPFSQKINTSLARGNVDEWLKQVEQRMISSIKQQIQQSHSDFFKVEREEFILDKCAMAVIIVQMTQWTFLVQKTIKQQNLQDCLLSTKNNVDSISKLIRNSQIQMIQRQRLQTLLILSIHNYQIVNHLKHKNITNLKCFQWQSSLRYYYQNTFQDKELRTSVKCFNSSFQFNHQYQGNCSRLVITPLTERFYHTLTSAMFMNYASAIEGHSGTGKTQTIKDLAKAMGCQCIIFNCSQLFDSKAMSRFFKGMASSGAWCCFDQLNKINVEVLSVIGQQILCIQNAKISKNKRFIFQQIELPIKNTANVFITFNSSTTEKNILPSNLRSLFRPFSMMVPNSQKISQIQLLSYGFKQSKKLSKKIIFVYKYCAQQLSAQNNYDFGIRTIKKVLKHAKNLKKQNIDASEESIILKSMQTVSYGCFNENNTILFQGILKDMFCDICPVSANLIDLMQNIKQKLEKKSLISNSYIIKKIVQIYEILQISKGIMLIGQNCSGKTVALDILKQIFNDRQKSKNQESIQTIKIKHKSVASNQLFGKFNQLSRQWIDGLITVKFKTLAYSSSQLTKWLVFDGPLNSEWIEKMNTVLDQNKKLLLASGQNIPLGQNMNLFFQSANLFSATPSTISRCAMVYFQSQYVGNKAIIDSWKKRSPKIGKSLNILIDQFFTKIPLVTAQIQSFKRIIKLTQSSSIITFIQIFDHFIQKVIQIIENSIKSKGQFLKMEQKNRFQKQILLHQKQIFSMIGGAFFFSIIWSFGTNIDTAYKKNFQLFLKRLIIAQFSKSKNQKVILPQKGSLFEYTFIIQQRSDNFSFEWKKWSQYVSNEYSQNSSLDTLIVKTPTTISYSNFINLYLKRNVPVVLCGSPGTGKTVLIRYYFQFYQDKVNQKMIKVFLCQNTTCENIQHQIQTNLEKKGSKIILGPKNYRQMFVCIEDLSLSTKQVSGVQPPLQFLSQILDDKGFYDLRQRQKHFKKIINMYFILTMTPNQEIDSRLLRHVNVLCLNQLDEDEINQIFLVILNTSFTGHTEQKNMKTLLKHCLQVYNSCKINCLPTPNRSHYGFNLKDLWKLVISICGADKQKIHSQNIGRLWAHQVQRTFKDRLLSQQRNTIDDLIESVSKKWGKNITNSYFTNILSTSYEKSYEQVSDLQKISLSVSSYLGNYNAETQKPIDIVLFKYALQHILIIHRIIQQPRGNALLIGMSGSGRKSFTRLASFIANHKTFQIQQTKDFSLADFRKILKNLFLQIIIKKKQICWMLNDLLFKKPEFHHDINTLQNAGFIESIYSNQQRIEICQKIRKIDAQQLGNDITPNSIFSYFQTKVKNNLKLTILLSPVGQSLRKRIRSLPSLINCATIDWYENWPEQGLVSVANKVLKSFQMNNKDKIMKMISLLHQSSQKWRDLYESQVKRVVYITPSSFMEFLTIFKTILSKKRKQTIQMIMKYENGYKKIIDTQQAIEQMKINIEEMKPKLKKAAEQTAIKFQQVKLQKLEADMIMDQVYQEEKIVSSATKQAEILKKQCEETLAVVLPHLKQAQEGLQVLDKNSLNQLKSMNNPPPAVKLVFQGLCLLVDSYPKQKIKNQKTFKLQTDWWAASVRNLGNVKLLQNLVSFNKENINEKIITTLGSFLNEPQNKQVLQVSNVAKSSLACECIIKWINGIYNFYFVNKKIQPKKQQLQTAQQKVLQLNKRLDLKRQEMQNVNKKAMQLNYQYEWSQKTKQRIQSQYKQCEVSLHRSKLITLNLINQKTRWLNLSEVYKKMQTTIDADSLLSSAHVCYLGPFFQQYRQKIIQQWKSEFQKHHLHIKDDFNFINFLSTPIKIKQWNIKGLPTDNYSVQNAIILYNSKRWPLLIDPQQQGKKWLKSQQAHRNIKSIKYNQQNLVRNLQNCIQFGTPALIQNLQQEINAALNPILLKQTYKKGPTTYLKMGQNSLIYSNDFFLYMTTMSRNPHYSPQICTHISLINFTITENCLIDQFLSLILKIQKQSLDEQKLRLIIQQSQNQKGLQEIQSRILDVLVANNNILLDQTCLDILTASKQRVRQINQKQQVLKQTQKMIEEARLLYQPLAYEASLLFISVCDLIKLNPMYQYSMEYFISILISVLTQSEANLDQTSKIQYLKNLFRSNLFKCISRSLFEKDKLIFALIITFKLQKYDSRTIRKLLGTQISQKTSHIQKPINSWITDSIWMQLTKLIQMDQFQNLVEVILEEKNQKYFQKIVKSFHPYSCPLPFQYQTLPFKYKYLIYKSLRPENTIDGLRMLVKQAMSKKLIQSIKFDLKQIYLTSDFKTPLLFIISSNFNPLVIVSDLAKQRKIQLESVSIGQGQGHIAQRMIRQNIIKGGWVILQNCHLSLPWMQNLIKILQQNDSQDKQVNQNFRLWLTSQVVDNFPQQILQRSLKITNQSPSGLKNSLLNTYCKQISDKINLSEKDQNDKLRKMYFNIGLFHAIVQQRNTYGSIGWNIPYDFSEADFKISCQAAENAFVNSNGEGSISFQSFKYLVGECYYGGRVIDNNDRQLLIQIFNNLLDQNSLNSNKAAVPAYYPNSQLKKGIEYINYIESIPEIDSTLICGLNQNANILKVTNQSKQIINSLSFLFPKHNEYEQRGYTQKKDNVINTVLNILNQSNFPNQFQTQNILKKFPFLYEQPLNSILQSQTQKYNILIRTIKNSLTNLLLALQGHQILTFDLQNLMESILFNKIPQIWLSSSVSTLQPLGSYLEGLFKKIYFFKSWIKNGTLSSFQLSAFFCPQSFLSAVLQNCSRKTNTPIQQLAINFTFKSHKLLQKNDTLKIYGLYVQGVIWNQEKQIFQESIGRQLINQAPQIIIKPMKIKDISQSQVFKAPLYRTINRKDNTMSIKTGMHNFITLIDISVQIDKSICLKRGIAFFLENDV